MSMLAERKTKVNYILNPRKTVWKAEENNFGRKLMEKMGWSEGRGLGKTEQGITQSIKVSYKNDSKGMGYKGPVDDPVLHQDEFSQLLADLNQTHEVTALPETKVSSLEKRSEASRKRVHYKKFTQSKDISRYSEQDLECIIGSLALNKKKKNKKTEEENETEGEKSRFGVETTNGGLMEDYFNKKMKDKNISLPTEIGKEKKKSKKKYSDVIDIFEKDDSNYDPLALFKKRVSNKTGIEKPKEKKQKIEVEEIDIFENDDSNYDPLALLKKRVSNKTGIEEPKEKKQKIIEVEEVVVKKKKSKKNKSEIVEEVEEESVPVKSKKSKKNKK